MSADYSAFMELVKHDNGYRQRIIDRLTHRMDKQQAKVAAIGKYDKPLCEQHDMKVTVRLNHALDELTDFQMYIEHLLIVAEDLEERIRAEVTEEVRQALLQEIMAKLRDGHKKKPKLEAVTVGELMGDRDAVKTVQRIAAEQEKRGVDN